MSLEPIWRTIALRPHPPSRPRRPAWRWPPKRRTILSLALSEMMTATLTAKGWRVSRPTLDHHQRQIPARRPLTCDEEEEGAAAAWLAGLPEPLQPSALSMKARKKFTGVEKGPVMSGDGVVVKDMTLRILKSVSEGWRRGAESGV